MIIFSLISIIQLNNSALENSNAFLANSLLTCDNLDVYFDSDIIFLCKNQFNKSTIPMINYLILKLMSKETLIVSIILLKMTKFFIQRLKELLMLPLVLNIHLLIF